MSAKLSTNLTHQTEQPDNARYSLVTTYSRYRDAWIVSTLGLFEGNRDLGFTFRGTLAESVGRYLTSRTSHHGAALCRRHGRWSRIARRHRER